MELLLSAKDVIIHNERAVIKSKVGQKKMEYLIMDIIIPSLMGKFNKKYKSFLESMEESKDKDLQDMAKRLGKLGCVFKCSKYYINLYTVVWKYFVVKTFRG